MATKSKFSDVLSKIAFVIAVLLTLFQSYTALFGVLTAVYQRAIHLGLASSYIFLFNMANPKEKGKVFHIIINFIGLVASAGSNFYICLHYAEIQGRLGITTELDMIFGALLLVVLGAPALIKLGADPLPAHLFILYFGCMSTITPPVALSTYAAAGISGGSPMKTGIYAMKLASVAFLIPYIFVYGQELLLYGSLGSILLAILSASLGCVALAGGMIGWLGAKMPMPLRFVLVGAAITLMIPGALTDVIGVVLMAVCVITAVTLSKRQTPKIQ